MNAVIQVLGDVTLDFQFFLFGVEAQQVHMPTILFIKAFVKHLRHRHDIEQSHGQTRLIITQKELNVACEWHSVWLEVGGVQVVPKYGNLRIMC